MSNPNGRKSLSGEAAATLTEKQEAFCQHYAADPKGAEAARAAGYAAGRAKREAHELLKLVAINARIREIKNDQFKRLHMEADELLMRIAENVRASFEEVAFVTEGGDPYIDMRKASPAFLRAVRKMKIEDFVDSRERDENGEVVTREVRRIEVELVDRLKAGEMLMKHLGLLKERVEVTIDESFAEMLMKAARKDGT